MVEYIAFMGAVLGYPLAWYFGGKRKEDSEIKKNCRIVHMLVYESLEMYEEGDMDLKEMIEDLCKALKAV